MATAPARTASPASCPPISRVSTGTVAEASCTCSALFGLTLGRPSEPLPGGVVLAPTVGNKFPGSPGETPVPEIVGNVDGGGRFVTGSVGVALTPVGFTTTTSVAEPVKALALGARAVADSCTCSPRPAPELTLTPISSSSAWPTGTLPTLHVVPWATGQIEKLGLPMSSAEATCAVSVTPVLSAFVLQTQTTKSAVCPAFTSEEEENDWIFTHSWGVFVAGELGEPLGLGLGLGLEESVGLGLGLELVLVSLPVGEGLALDD